MGVCCEGVKGASAKPPCRRRSGETPAAHKQIHIENSSHKTHLIQPIRRVRCVSFAKKSAPKKGGIPAGTPPLEALAYTFWKVNTTSPPSSGAISSTVVSNS